MDPVERQVFAIRQPVPALLRYYVITSFVAGPLFFLPLIPFYFRYHTMRYAFDEEGITMRWGILFRREISLTYARIQDIHLTSNFIERWLGLARLQIQTASGSADAEMTLEGIPQFTLVRDYLYSRMRGIRAQRKAPGTTPPVQGESADLGAVLGEVAGEMRAIRELLVRLVERSDSR